MSKLMKAFLVTAVAMATVGATTVAHAQWTYTPQRVCDYREVCGLYGCRVVPYNCHFE